ncbi:Annexin A13 [Holothuria leucospilota]|uniref:Annexin n=1 Tax=Holothuria leucospilota TaxID=206669 RepID=A0A9Q1BUI8_HOLLE|nr:Annexin A13 [Holothuria leucospilota]
MAQSVDKPTVIPVDDFDPNRDRDLLNDAFKGFGISVFRVGTKDDVIISILTKRSLKQRQEIQDAYKEKFGKDLKEELRSELSGNYLSVMEALFDTPGVLLAKRVNRILNKMISAPGSEGKDIAILEIVYPLKKQETDSLIVVYQEVFKKSLLDDVEEKLDGNFKDTVIEILKNGRSDEEPSPQRIQEDVGLLLQLDPIDWSPCNPDLMKIFLSSSTYLFYMFSVLQATKPKSLVEIASTQTNEEYRDGFVTMVHAANGLRRFLADLLYQAMKGLGTEDEKLLFLVVSRCEVDLGNIEDEFEAKYGQSLQNFIRADTSGDFQKVLLSLCSPEEVENDVNGAPSTA